MAHFISVCRGHGGEASRLGTKNSGIVANAQGWSVGAKIIGHHDKETGLDTFEVYATSGSSMNQQSVLIGRFTDLEEVLNGKS